MKITSKILRDQYTRIRTISSACVEGSAEDYLRKGLLEVAFALDEIHSDNPEVGDKYHLPRSFQLDTDPQPSDLPVFLEPLSQDESNPVRLWAEIWKLRSEAKGPDEHQTWRNAAIDEKTKRIRAEKELQTIKDRLLTLSQGPL